MKKMKIKIPIGKHGFMLILTKNLYNENFEKMKKIIETINWDNSKFVMFPSEFIHSVKYVKRRWKKK